jgi:hypothetical protein
MVEPDISNVVLKLLDDLITGSKREGSWILNPEDPGLLESLNGLSAAQASEAPNGGSSIASHVEHLRYGLELLNRSSRGEDPFENANFSASWDCGAVSSEEWAARRKALADEAHSWRAAIERPDNSIEFAYMISSVVHLAYPLGAIRQINRSIRGPLARD